MKQQTIYINPYFNCSDDGFIWLSENPTDENYDFSMPLWPDKDIIVTTNAGREICLPVDMTNTIEIGEKPTRFISLDQGEMITGIRI
jgi:hypothetical protein